ncbi:MAG: flagellar type III secretion system pore protein FliP [Gemmatimonadaceae bacterium]
MTFSSLVGVALTLALVLGLLAITMRLLRKVSQGGAMGRAQGAIPLEVVQRMSLGPRQGIAVVRIGEQLVAVSVGEGGVRPIVELENMPVLPPALDTSALSHTAPNRDFKSALMHGLRSAGLPLVVTSVLAAGAFARPVAAQSATATGGTTPAAPAATRNTPATTPQAQAATPRAQVAAQVAQPQKATSAAPAAPAGNGLDAALGRALPTLDLKVDGGQTDGLRLSGTVGVVIMLGLLTLLPTLVLMMSSFTRVLIVLQFLKQALGTQTAPPNQLISALALLITGFVMAPTMTEVNRVAITPWLDGKIEQGVMMQNALGPMREFMLRQTRERDIAAFVEMSRTAPPARIEDVSTIVLTSAFVTSELRTAFQLGFVLFLPFIVIDIVVSSVLMSMGMFMLPPAMIALPFKLLLFVLVDGWSLLIQSLVLGFK